MMVFISSIRAEEIGKEDLLESLEADCIDCKIEEEKSEKLGEQVQNIEENIIQNIVSHYDAYFFVKGILEQSQQLPAVNTNNVSYPTPDVLPKDPLKLPQWEEDKALTSDFRLEFNPTYYDFTRQGQPLEN